MAALTPYQQELQSPNCTVGIFRDTNSIHINLKDNDDVARSLQGQVILVERYTSLKGKDILTKFWQEDW